MNRTVTGPMISSECGEVFSGLMISQPVKCPRAWSPVREPTGAPSLLLMAAS